MTGFTLRRAWSTDKEFSILRTNLVLRTPYSVQSTPYKVRIRVCVVPPPLSTSVQSDEAVNSRDARLVRYLND